MRGGQPKDGSLIGRKLADALWLPYANRAYVERHSRPEKLADFDKHSVVVYTGVLSELGPGRWLKSIAPNAKIAGYSNSVSGAPFCRTVWAGVGHAARSRWQLGQ